MHFGCVKSFDRLQKLQTSFEQDLGDSRSRSPSVKMLVITDTII